MTITGKASSLTSTKKNPISATKSWNKVRRACIEKLRRNVFNTPDKSTFILNDDNSPLLRNRLEDQLRRFGIVVASPCSDEINLNETHNKLILQESAGFYNYDNLDDNDTRMPIADHYITEDELFDLLQDLEYEIEQEKLKTFEEMTDGEKEYLNQQIADYEQWEEAQVDNDDNSSCQDFVCPMCNEADVIRTPSGGIVCPNHMDVSCLMECIDLKGLQPDDIRCRIGNAITNHSYFCSAQLMFSVNCNILTAECAICSAKHVIF
jgi:Replication protein A interacting C-terminal